MVIKRNNIVRTTNTDVSDHHSAVCLHISNCINQLLVFLFFFRLLKEHYVVLGKTF